MAFKLIELELRLTNGIIGGPLQAPRPQVSKDSDKDSALRLTEELAKAKQEKDETQAKKVLVKLFDILVTKNARAESISKTLSDDELKAVIEKLQPLVKTELKSKLKQPSDLNGFKNPDDFHVLFLPLS